MRILVIAATLLASTVTATACGNPMLWAMLFSKVPDARIVFEAEQVARSSGLITARVYDAKLGQPYHSWSKAWLLDLAREMQPAIEHTLRPGETLTILLADEVAALRFNKGFRPEFVAPGELGDVEAYDMITTINALKDAWSGKVSYSDLVAHTLIGGDHEAVKQKLVKLF